MSLDDRFNPNDGSIIDKLDSALFNFNKKIATKWQDKTYKRKEDLERALYFGGATILMEYVANATNTIDFFTLPIIINGVLRGSIEKARPKSAKHEEIQDEFLGLPRKTTKYLNVMYYGAGVSMTLIGIVDLIAGAVSENNEWYNHSIKDLSLGLGLLFYTSANYIAKSDIGTPHPKPKKKPVLERIKEKVERFLPQPTPNPISVGMYSEINSYSLSSSSTD